MEYFQYFSTKFDRISVEKAHIEERELVAWLLRKDRAALAYLYDHYSGALYGIVLRIISKEEVAEEVLQDVFLKIWDKIEAYDATKGRLFTWMINIARNQAIDRTRSKEISNGGKTGTIENLVNSIDRKGFVEQEIEGIGMSEVLRSLPAEQKFVVEHLYFKGFTQSELAEEFNIPLGTVKTRLRSALKHLRLVIT
ncbi:MAG: sigma-70 family RNA polymerase sigma factor [Cytophagales bacterium]|nr:sigma-70 family RNA polymerase sigma factor [Cytophagales bacterium]